MQNLMSHSRSLKLWGWDLASIVPGHPEVSGVLSGGRPVGLELEENSRVVTTVDRKSVV